jgi:hypothetical protein
MEPQKPTYLESQPKPEPLDEAEAAFERGEGVTLQQSTINLRKRIPAWRVTGVLCRGYEKPRQEGLQPSALTGAS